MSPTELIKLIGGRRINEGQRGVGGKLRGMLA